MIVNSIPWGNFHVVMHFLAVQTRLRLNFWNNGNEKFGFWRKGGAVLLDTIDCQSKRMPGSLARLLFEKLSGTPLWRLFVMDEGDLVWEIESHPHNAISSDFVSPRHIKKLRTKQVRHSINGLGSFNIQFTCLRSPYQVSKSLDTRWAESSGSFLRFASQLLPLITGPWAIS